MTRRPPTYRFVDDERIAGVTRHAFVRYGDRYHLTDLRIFADGMIDCGGLVTLEEFGARLRSGWVATEIEEGTTGEASGLFTWKFARTHTHTKPKWLLAEVRDEIERLNGRPTSPDRFLRAVKDFLKSQSENDRALARDAYLEVPPSQHHTIVGIEELIGGLRDRSASEYDRTWALNHYKERFAAVDSLFGTSTGRKTQGSSHRDTPPFGMAG